MAAAVKLRMDYSALDLRRLAARTPEDLAAALLDFICGDDARLIGFAEASGWTAARVAYARAALEAGAVG